MLTRRCLCLLVHSLLPLQEVALFIVVRTADDGAIPDGWFQLGGENDMFGEFVEGYPCHPFDEDVRELHDQV